jgi:O-antigen/teichoic acid export membrane protein
MAAVQGRDNRAAHWLWHDTMARLALMIFPLAAFLVVMAHDIIVLLFTSAYEASVPIFMLWSLTMLASVMVVDGVLRVYAQTRFLLAQNVLHLAIVAALVGVFLTLFGLEGAVLVSLFATLTVKGIGAVRICRVMQVPLADALPWRRLAMAGSFAVIAAVPTFAITRTMAFPPLVALPIGALSYGSVYGLLVYASHRRESSPCVELPA